MLKEIERLSDALAVERTRREALEREVDRWRGDHATNCTLLPVMAAGVGSVECSCGWDEPDLRAIRAKARAEALEDAASLLDQRLDGSAQDYEVAQCAAAIRAKARRA